jgi:hypothetical protein
VYTSELLQIASEATDCGNDECEKLSLWLESTRDRSLRNEKASGDNGDEVTKRIVNKLIDKMSVADLETTNEAPLTAVENYVKSVSQLLGAVSRETLSNPVWSNFKYFEEYVLSRFPEIKKEIREFEAYRQDIVENFVLQRLLCTVETALILLKRSPANLQICSVSPHGLPHINNHRVAGIWKVGSSNPSKGGLGRNSTTPPNSASDSNDGNDPSVLLSENADIANKLPDVPTSLRWRYGTYGKDGQDPFKNLYRITAKPTPESRGWRFLTVYTKNGATHEGQSVPGNIVKHQSRSPLAPCAAHQAGICVLPSWLCTHSHVNGTEESAAAAKSKLELICPEIITELKEKRAKLSIQRPEMYKDVPTTLEGTSKHFSDKRAQGDREAFNDWHAVKYAKLTFGFPFTKADKNSSEKLVEVLSQAPRVTPATFGLGVPSI